MLARLRIAVDTNALVSRLLVPNSTPARAVRKAVEDADLLVSEATMAELAEVLARSRFDPYLTVRERQAFISLISRVAEMVPVARDVHVCRDPRDDKFLALAVTGEASLIVSGDRDLLVLDPFCGIRIRSPAAYVSLNWGVS